NPAWTLSNNNIDKSTAWSYDAVTTNPNNTSQSMKITMTQGSPFTYLTFNNTNEFTLTKLRTTFSSEVIFDEVYNGCRMLVFRTLDTTNQVHYPMIQNQYYALYLPQNTTVEYKGTTDTTGNDKIGSRRFVLPSGKTYATFAWITESESSSNNSNAVNIAKQYRPYAFNFITDTQISYNVSNGNVVDTTYSYTFDKKAESTADGTVMGILSHQYRYMSGYNYLSNQAFTIRGDMKFLTGSSYTTSMKYKGILPSMPAIADNDTAGKAALQEYVDNYVNIFDRPDTYWRGKQYNRSAQAINAAKAIGDEAKAEKLIEGLEKELEDWFTYSGEDDKKFFTYLGDGMGTLLGSRMDFYGIDQMNDHHFHYGYFIESAAIVGMYDPEWLASYSSVIKQLIYDIASPYRSSSDCVSACGNAYPYLRCFAPFEGHSYASGFQDEKDGNNQESTSEAINAWAGIILFGELTNDTNLKKLGKYLYTTEIAAAGDYWFDYEKDTYKVKGSKYDPPMAGMVWTGKIDYRTYFGFKYVQAIQIFPMQPWSFYLLEGGTDYIRDYINYNNTSPLAEGGSVNEWNDIWSEYYALVDPDDAMNSMWTHVYEEQGESAAHTYHFIRTLQNYGTPDLSFTSNTPMSAVFNKNGVYTYVVYNPGTTVNTVVFNSTNGTVATVKAAPKTMTVVNSNDLATKSPYKVEYYGKNKSGSGYSVISTEIKYAPAGTTVTAATKDITGFEYDANNSSNIKSSSVLSNGTTSLKLYYNRETYSISYELNGGSKANTSLYPSTYEYGDTFTFDTPVKDGYDFYGWYKDEDFSVKLNTLKTTTHGNVTLRAKWIPSGTIMASEDIFLSFDKNGKGHFYFYGDTDMEECSVLYKIYDTESEALQAKKDGAEVGYTAYGLHKTPYGYSNELDLSGSTGKYITFYFIRYKNGTGSQKSLYGCGKIIKGSIDIPVDYETVTTVLDGPREVFGENIRSEADNTITVVWGNAEGHKYNVYVDGVKYLNEVYCGEYVLRQIPGGKRIVKITAVYEGKESNGVTKEVQVGGSSEIQTSEPGGEDPSESVSYDGDGPLEVIGANAYSASTGKITVVWGTDDLRNASGQKYNIYLDNTKVKSEVACGSYDIDATPGEHTVKITATLDGTETAGVTKIVTVAEPLTDDNGQTIVTEKDPIEVIGLTVSSKVAGKINVVWGQTTEQIALGQTYNIYVDNVKVKSEVPCGSYDINVEGGRHTVKVTATISGKESNGATGTVDVEQAEATTVPTVVTGTELLKNTAFNGATNWKEESENGATFTNNGNGSLSVSVPKYTTGNNYATQLRQDAFQLVAGKWYKATFTVTSDVDKTFQMLVQNNINWAVYGQEFVSVAANKTETCTMWFQATETTTDVLFGIMLGYVNNTASEAANVTIKNVSLKVYDNKVEDETETETEYVPNKDAYGNIISSDLEISGYQINTSFGGHRVVYSMNNTVENKEVTEFGLIYGLQYGSYKESDMKIGSNNYYVKSFKGTEANGRLSSCVNADMTKSYAMTMSFFEASAREFNDTYVVRAYAKLSDGTYAYSTIQEYTINEVASYIYTNKTSPSAEAHNYLYNNILKVCNPNYAKINY
ncbi:MAG: InlB B-repeat-containing protein, partial [Lachnospiraceae bacterium]|nr:InlB B-repeat-containing protein [Lachnospiraceae bacterium]